MGAGGGPRPGSSPWRGRGNALGYPWTRKPDAGHRAGKVTFRVIISAALLGAWALTTVSASIWPCPGGHVYLMQSRPQEHYRAGSIFTPEIASPIPSALPQI
jgi:hypothetical protein